MDIDLSTHQLCEQVSTSPAAAGSKGVSVVSIYYTIILRKRFPLSIDVIFYTSLIVVGSSSSSMVRSGSCYKRPARGSSGRAC